MFLHEWSHAFEQGDELHVGLFLWPVVRAAESRMIRLRDSRYAILYTIVENCRRLGINPKEYLIDVLTRLPQMLAKDAITLTPANWLNARSGKEVSKAA